MSPVTIKINTYEVRFYGDTDGGSSSFFAHIICRSAEWQLILRFLTPGSEVPDNLFQPSLKRIYVFIPGERLPYYVDLLRNEKPISFQINTDNPNLRIFYTGEEPVGEEEEKELMRVKTTRRKTA